jgi:ribosomal protein S18 acetylase RimI-like enzyme
MINGTQSSKPGVESSNPPREESPSVPPADPQPRPQAGLNDFNMEQEPRRNACKFNGTGSEANPLPDLLHEMAGAADDTPPVHVRPFRESDREAFCRLCCDTGFLGDPMDVLFQDRELFADLFTRPYLDYEPEWVLVAEVHGQVVGYLTGSVCKHFDVVLLWSGLRTTLKMLLRLARGRYGRHPRSRRFIRWLLTAGFREQPKHPRDAAHLHIQIDKRYRGRGIGRQLWERYEKELRAIGMTQCYGAFFSYPQRRPEVAYSRYGFTVFDRRPTTMFQPEIREPVEVVCVCKKL